jgi:hypothetical protein
MSDLISRLHLIGAKLATDDFDTINEAISALEVKHARDCRSEYYMKLSKLSDEAEALSNRVTDLSV